VLEASDLAAEYSEMVDKFEWLIALFSAFGAFLLMPSRLKDAMSISLHEYYERPVPL
jgi:hypothetical protein